MTDVVALAAELLAIQSSTGSEAPAVDFDADRAQAAVGEGERQRQADAAATDDGDVVFHTAAPRYRPTAAPDRPLPSDDT